MPQLDTHDPHIADIFRRATLERERQDKRIADIFGMQTVPKVIEETLTLYLHYLKQHLEVPCQLTGIESRGCFAWEASYIFGRRCPQEYAQRKQQQPSYTDTYAFLAKALPPLRRKDISTWRVIKGMGRPPGPRYGLLKTMESCISIPWRTLGR